MHLRTVLGWCLASFLAINLVAALPMHPSSSPTNPTDTVTTLFQFPKGTWIENLAVRANGDILLTLLNVPELYLLNPHSTQPPVLVQSFPNATGLAGIVEIADDKFAVIAGNYSFTAGPAAGTWSVWSVDMEDVFLSDKNNTLSSPPTISKIASIASATFLNGISSLPGSPSLVLVGDIGVGDVYALNVQTGAYTVAISDALTAAVSVPVFGHAGINGLHVRDGDLYFTNTATGVFGRVPINTDGTAAGNASVVARVLAPTDDFDDFTFDAVGNAYLVTGSGNAVEMLGVSGNAEIVAGSLNSTAIAEPTACAFGRGEGDEQVLYVTTAGGLAFPVDGDVTVGGQVVAVDTRHWRQWNEWK